MGRKRIKIKKWLYRVPSADGGGFYYQAIFTDWQKIPRCFPLGEDEEAASDRLGELRSLNGRRFDFGLPARQQRQEEKKRREEAEHKGLTLGEWVRRYFDKIAPTLDKRPRTLKREEEFWTRRIGERQIPSPLQDHFGSMALPDIKLTAYASYRVQREKEVSFVTVNREVAFVRYLLNLAVEEGLLEAAPRIRLKNEQGTVRTRTLTPEEYAAIISHMGREQQRYHIALYETAMRLREPTKVTWPKVDLKANLIRLDGSDTKERWPRRIPINMGATSNLGRVASRAIEDSKRRRVCLHAHEWAGDPQRA